MKKLRNLTFSITDGVEDVSLVVDHVLCMVMREHIITVDWDMRGWAYETVHAFAQVVMDHMSMNGREYVMIRPGDCGLQLKIYTKERGSK